MAIPGYLPAPIGEAPPTNLREAASLAYARRIATVLNSVQSGKMNVVLPVTLAASVTTTTITDSRIGPFSALLFSPITADAAAAISTLFVSSQLAGSAVLTHTSSATVDRTFNMAIVG